MTKLKIESVVHSGTRHSNLNGETVFCLSDLKKNYKGVTVQLADVKKVDFGTGKLLNAVSLKDVSIVEESEETEE